MNLSLTTGEIPEELKESIIKPIFKDGDKKEPANHRPISLLNAISKILEKIIHKQVYQYFLENNLLSKKQFGFLNKSSCEHAMISLLSTIEINKQHGKHTNLTFIDLSKAFDTLNHEILIKKLTLYGIQNTELLWFKNYLLNRKHATNFKGEISERLNTNTGVPQGSILGPLLFLIYINDLAINIEGSLLYADDTTLINEDSNIQELEVKANQTITIADDWFKANKLTLNAKKTRNMTLLKDRTNADLNILLEGNKIMNINSKSTEKYFKFLGFRMDDKLNWKHHIKHVSNKLKAINHIIASIKNSHPMNIKKTRISIPKPITHQIWITYLVQ